MTRRLNSRRIRELDPRLAWLLMTLYPRTWRDRYGAEVLRLTRELIAAGETTPARAAVNLACAAVAERCRALGHSWRPAMAVAATALLALAASSYATGHAHRATSARATPASAVPAAGHAPYGSSDHEEKIKAGIAGEDLVAAELGRRLDDS